MVDGLMHIKIGLILTCYNVNMMHASTVYKIFISIPCIYNYSLIVSVLSCVYLLIVYCYAKKNIVGFVSLYMHGCECIVIFRRTDSINPKIVCRIWKCTHSQFFFLCAIKKMTEKKGLQILFFFIYFFPIHLSIFEDFSEYMY